VDLCWKYTACIAFSGAIKALYTLQLLFPIIESAALHSHTVITFKKMEEITGVFHCELLGTMNASAHTRLKEHSNEMHIFLKVCIIKSALLVNSLMVFKTIELIFAMLFKYKFLFPSM
jgi:hypothetical protein